MKIKIFRIVSVLFLVAVMAAIFYLSAQDATESDETSGSFIKTLIGIFYPKFKSFSVSKQAEIVGIFSFWVRKTAHFSIYFSLGVFSFLSVITYKSLKLSIRVFISCLICVLYSVSDEIHQYFVAGRSCEFRDVLIDSCGALLAVFVSVYVLNKRKLKELYKR